VWPDVLDQVRSRSRRTRALLDNASIAAVDGTLIRLAATSAPIAKMIADDSNLAVLRDALGAVIGGGWTIEIGTDAAGSSAPSGPAEAPDSGGGPVEWTRPAAPVRPAPVTAPREDDGVDEDGDEVHGQQRDGADPEAAAIQLLQNSLGARPLEG
jgi:DNA polymerase-3 subunit gamma/tau